MKDLLDVSLTVALVFLMLILFAFIGRESGKAYQCNEFASYRYSYDYGECTLIKGE